jgi:hypothetical protein
MRLRQIHLVSVKGYTFTVTIKIFINEKFAVIEKVKYPSYDKTTLTAKEYKIKRNDLIFHFIYDFDKEHLDSLVKFLDSEMLDDREKIIIT